MLVHLVDLDSEAHDQGPFDRNANAILERTDELLASVVAALPADYDLVVTSDHGFERTDHIANLLVLMGQAGGVKGDLQPMGGVVVARDAAAADFLRGLAVRGQEGLGREIPRAELERYAPKLATAVAVFEPAPHYMFGRAETGDYLTAPREKGEHGLWPLRADYRSVYIARGPGIAPRAGPQIEMLSIRSRLAALLGAPACGSPPGRAGHGNRNRCPYAEAQGWISPRGQGGHATGRARNPASRGSEPQDGAVRACLCPRQHGALL